MPLGFDHDLNVINLNDTADIYGYILDPHDVPIPEDDLLTVQFKIQRPDGTEATINGSIEGDGTGYAQYNGTNTVGEYKAVATFTLADTRKKSVRSDFEVIDPFDPPVSTDGEVIASLIWKKFEDLFDSEEGGPWLQDVTKATFKKEKMEQFIAEGLFDINNQSPPTSVGLEQFVLNGEATADAPLVAKAGTLAVIRHLMRAYVEQPNPLGAQIAYEDRRDYLQRWQTILQEEEEAYYRQLAFWKRQFLGLGGSRVLVSSKAGRLIPAPMRTRNVGRGYW